MRYRGTCVTVWRIGLPNVLNAMVVIHPETPANRPAVRHVNELAFCQPNEADLVDMLRSGRHMVLSLVAEFDDAVIGHILFTHVNVESAEACWSAVGLGPMAVLPEHQRHGVGSQLVREGLKRCRHAGYLVVFVVGHPEYYPRFGFVPAPPQGITSPWPVPDDAFMLAELEPGALKGRQGVLKFAPAFDSV